MRTLSFAAVSLWAFGCASDLPVPIESPGLYSHAGSHVAFPPEAEGFTRVSLVKRDRDGERVTAGYSGGTPRCPAAITFWIDPVEQPLDATAAGARSALEADYPGAVLESKQAGEVAEMPAQQMLYDLQDRRLHLVVIAKPGWYLRYRVMYPAHCADDADLRVRNFLGALPR